MLPGSSFDFRNTKTNSGNVINTNTNTNSPPESEDFVKDASFAPTFAQFDSDKSAEVEIKSSNIGFRSHDAMT